MGAQAGEADVRAGKGSGRGQVTGEQATGGQMLGGQVGGGRVGGGARDRGQAASPPHCMYICF